VRENRDNRFYQSPLGRWVTRIGLMFRGYMLSENELVERWVDTVFEGVQDLLPAMLQLLGEMEVYLAVLAFKDAAEAKRLAVCLPELSEPDLTQSADQSQRFVGLFNPLLFTQGAAPIACDLALGGFRTTTLVTGPNSGGKTRLLQAIALAHMLGQTGFYVPAARAVISRTRGLFVSLIEEARADQKEGRLGTELMRIRQLFERTHPGSLIILDELCSGTNPSEGEEIIRLVLSLLDELQANVFITTHFLQFAKRLSDEPSHGLRFLQVELDPQERPTYGFVPGVAQTSLAHQTASRLGVTRDELLALVRRNAPKGSSGLPRD
jgi:DNA mismatch repair protein MutS2